MELGELSSRFGNFYAPACSVRVDGQDLTRDLALAVGRVEVELRISEMARFSFSLVNCFDVDDFRSGRGQDVLALLQFGASIEVAMGYGEHGRLPVLLGGTITQIDTNFTEGGSPELVVSGFDHLFPMSLGTESRNWRERRHDALVNWLAGQYDLDVDAPETLEHEQVEQNQQNDKQFLKALAEQNNFIFYVTPQRVLRFRPPQTDVSPVATLRWGRTLSTFRPSGNLAAQVSGVEVYGWNRDTKESIVGRARAGDETGRQPGRTSAGDRLSQAMPDPPILRVRQPVFSQAEADRRAQAILTDYAREFVTGEGECVGLPELLPDRKVGLEGLGTTFSKPYYITQTVHTVDGNGYRTRFTIEESTL